MSGDGLAAARHRRLPLVLRAVDAVLGLAVGDPAERHAGDGKGCADEDDADRPGILGGLERREGEQENAQDRDEIAVALEAVRVGLHALTNDAAAFWISP